MHIFLRLLPANGLPLGGVTSCNGKRKKKDKGPRVLALRDNMSDVSNKQWKW